jgi:transposase
MQSYSQDLRERALWALDRGERPTSITRRLEVSRVWVYQVRDRGQKSGSRTSFLIGGHRRPRVAEMESVLRAWIEPGPDLALSELSERLAKQGVLIEPGALWHQLNRWNLTFKKTLHASEQEREDLQQGRQAWVEALPGMDVENTPTSETFAPLYTLIGSTASTLRLWT